jgi:hypothetical protein
MAEQTTKAAMDDFSDDAGGVFPAVAKAQRLGQPSMLGEYSNSFKNMYGFRPETPFKAVANAALDAGKYLGNRLDSATAPAGYKPPVDTTRTGAVVDQATAFAKGLVSPEAQQAVANSGPVKAIAGTINAVTDSAPPVAAPPTTASSASAPFAGAAASPGSTFGKNLLLTGGLGLGAVGTYYLLNKLLSGRRKRQQHQSVYGPPKFASAGDIMGTIQDAAGKATDYVGDKVNAGLGAINLGDWTSPHPDGLRAGVAQKTMGIGGVAAGLGGTYLLAQYLAKRQKRQSEKDDIENARNEYLAALTGVKAAALDEAYEKYASLADIVQGIKNFGQGAADFGQKLPGRLQTVGEDYGALAALSGLTGAALGGTYMYNKTRNNSLSANALKAQALKARMRSLPGTWIDPEELVKVKQMALANNAAAT